MARTIGRKYKNMIVRLACEAKSHGVYSIGGIVDHVKEHLPSEAWDTWEMADSEIERLAEDEALAEVRNHADR